MARKQQLEELDLPKGFILADRFEVQSRLGGGWEGEVYSVVEQKTGIERAAKVFYPERNKRDRSSNFYAKKLHKLRNCSILIQYLFQDQFLYYDEWHTFLISEFVEGETLDAFLKRQKGKRLHPFQALHLLHALAKGMEEVHIIKEYHGDLHTGNVIVQRQGLGFTLKLIDMFHWGRASAENIREDVFNLIKIFHEVLGGKKTYAQQPAVVKEIICGLKYQLIMNKFRTAGQLRVYLENLVWKN